MLNIHILTAGENVHKVYQKIFPHYKVSKFIVLTEKSQPDKVRISIEKMKTGCEEIGIPIEILPIDDRNIPQLMESIIRVRKQYPPDAANLFFNITSGRKDFAIMAFIGSLWTEGTGYYLPEELQEPLVLPAPKIPLARLEGNRFYQRILAELKDKSGEISQSDLRAIIKVNPRNHKTLSGQTLSLAIDVLSNAGLVQVERTGRKTGLSLTLAGQVALSILQMSPKKE